MTYAKISHNAFCSLLLLAVSACGSMHEPRANMANDEVIVTDSFKSETVTAIVEEMARKRVLFVFDIDNTLLENPRKQFLGSAQWYDWQRSLDDTDSRKLKCRLEVQGAAYYIAHLLPTEGGYATDFLNKLQDSGHDVIALTARSPQFRYPTERELRRSEIDFSVSVPRSFPGIPSYYLPEKSPEIEVPRNASFQNGIAMLAGQHKGAGLVDLLKRIGAHDMYDVIVFFDDDIDNVEDMMHTFSSDSRKAIIFHYTAVNTDLGQYDLDKAVKGQDAIATAYAQFEQVPGCDI